MNIGKGQIPGIGVCLVTALLTSALPNLILPFQSYWVDASMFPYSFGSVVAEGLVRFVALFLVLFLGLKLTARYIGYAGVGLCAAVSVCVYLETGILAYGMPAMTGDLSFLFNTRRARVDALALFGAGVLTFIACLRLRKASIWLVLSVALLAGVSLLDVRYERRETTGVIPGCRRVPNQDLPCAVRYSPQRNVLLIVVDSLQSDELNAILADAACGKTLRDGLQGFTVYDDVVGLHDNTGLGIAGLLTGRHLDNPVKMADYMASVFTEQSLFGDYVRAGYAMYADVGSFREGLSNRVWTKADRDGFRRTFARRIGDQQNWNMDEILLFRLLPFRFKASYYLKLAQKWEKLQRSARTDVESALTNERWAEALSRAPVAEQENGSFIYAHLPGVHTPILCDRNGVVMPVAQNGFRGAVEMGVYVMKKITECLASLRSRGLYDSSLIVITADHGGHYNPAVMTRWKVGLPLQARPCLLIKGIGAQGPVRHSDAPVSQGRICALLKQTCTADLTSEEMTVVLQEEERFFRQIVGDVFYDWKVDGSTNVSYRATEHHASVEALTKLKLGTYYSLRNDPSDDPRQMEHATVDLAGCTRQRYAPSFVGSSTNMLLTVKVSMPGTYDLDLLFEAVSLSTNDGEECGFLEVLSNAGSSRAMLSFPLGPDYPGYAWQTVRGVVSDQAGILKVSLRRKNLVGGAFITELLLKPSKRL